VRAADANLLRAKHAPHGRKHSRARRAYTKRVNTSRRKAANARKIYQNKQPACQPRLRRA
jgi:hypothetical protein